MFETENIMGTKVINLHELISSASSHNSDLNSRRLKIINDIPYASEKIVDFSPTKMRMLIIIYTENHIIF